MSPAKPAAAPSAGPRPPFDPSLPGRTWPYALAVVLFPVLVLWGWDNALYTPAFYADPWFYQGYFRHLLEFKRNLFYSLYYGGRLGWVLPGAAVHALLPPLAANAALRLLAHSVAALSLFFLLRRLAGRRAALLGTMAFSANPWVWAALGWDYPDCAGIAYSLLALALVTRWAAFPNSRWTPIAAGAALGALVYTHLFWASLAPVFLLYAVTLAWFWHGERPDRLAFRLAGWVAAGFAAISAMLGGINYLLDGNVWFYSSSIAQAVGMAQDFRFVRSILDSDGRLVAWLWPAAAGVGCAFPLLAVRIRNRSTSTPGIVPVMLLLLPLAYMSWLQFRGSTVLGHYPYVSNLLPFLFTVFGVAFWGATDAMSRRAYVLLCGGTALAFAALWTRPYSPPNGYFLAAWPLGQQVALGAAVLGLAGGLVWRKRVAGVVLAAAGFAGFTALCQSRTTYLDGVDLHGNRQEFTRIAHASERIEAERRGHPIRFWFDRTEAGFFEYVGLNALYLSEFSRISEEFPRGCGGPVPPETLIVVTSLRPDAAEVARAALAACWAPYGMRADIVGTETVDRPGRPYRLAMLRARPDTARWRPVQANFDGAGKGTLVLAADAQVRPLPAERWKDRDGAGRPQVGGIQVDSRGKPRSTSIEYATLAAGFAGRYRFAIRCRDRVGRFHFAARHASVENSIGLDTTGHRVGDETEMAYWLTLREGEEVVVQLRPDRRDGRSTSAMLLGPLTVTAIPESGKETR